MSQHIMYIMQYVIYIVEGIIHTLIPLPYEIRNFYCTYT